VGGAKLALRMSDLMMYLVIVGVSMGLFVFIVVQKWVIA
jgi:hypothetical protein